MASLSIALPLAAVGCGVSKPTTTPPATATGAVTFWHDVAPIYNDKCVKCHQQGGIAPFRLDNFADASHYADAEMLQVAAGTMPPYFEVHSGACGDFHAEETLTDDEKATIGAWIDGARAEGAPAALTIPPVPVLEDAVELVTPLFAPVAQGGQLAQFDEYRCFLMNAPTTSDAFLTAYDVIPGDPSIVHHVLGFVVDPAALGAGDKTNAAIITELDSESPDRLGWPCFGAAGDGVSVSSLPVAWAPGQGIVRYPDGMGVPLHPTDKIVIQVHYNLSDPTSVGKTDATRVQLTLSQKVNRILAFALPDPFLDSLKNSPPDTLPPGQPAAQYVWHRTGKQLGVDGTRIPSVDLMAVFPHMHGRGVRQVMKLGDPGNLACASDLEGWNFHWQRFYDYKTVPTITPTTEIEVTCQYNTSTDAQPVLPGWGTGNEMCLAGLMMALPAAASASGTPAGSGASGASAAGSP